MKGKQGSKDCGAVMVGGAMRSKAMYSKGGMTESCGTAKGMGAATKGGKFKK